MLESETAKILAFAAAYDNRNVTREQIRAWHLAIGDLFVNECAEAVTEHFKESTEWMKPAHVRRIVLGARREAALEEGKQKRIMRDWLDERGIDWVQYEAGDPDTIAEVDRAKQKAVSQ